MQIEVLNNVIINYTENDIDYIEDLSKQILLQGQKILNYFNLEKLDKPTYIYFYNNLGTFKEKAKTRNSTGIVPNWLCGWASTKPNRYEVHVLSYSEYIKTQSHENDTIEDIITLVLHEFTHNCYDSYMFSNKNRKTLMWLHEALATTLSNQRNNLTISCSVDDLYNENQIAYHNYYTLGKYLLSNHNKEYILKLISDYKYLKLETQNIYDNTRKWLNSLNK